MAISNVYTWGRWTVNVGPKHENEFQIRVLTQTVRRVLLRFKLQFHRFGLLSIQMDINVYTFFVTVLVQVQLCNPRFITFNFNHNSFFLTIDHMQTIFGHILNNGKKI